MNPEKEIPLLSSLDRRNPVLTRSALLQGALFLVFLAAYFFETRTILGVNAWLKPLKFASSIFIYQITLVFYQKAFPPNADNKRISRLSLVIAATMIGEIIFVSVQALRGVRSHFNHDSILNGVFYSLMGILILINTVAVSLFFRNLKKHDAISPSMLFALRAGAVLFLLGSVFGGVMSGLDRHTVGGPDGGPGIPLLNWSAQHGDIRAAHFFGLHALQILPIFALFIRKKEKTGLMILFTALYGILVMAIFLRAMTGGNLLLFAGG